MVDGYKRRIGLRPALYTYRVSTLSYIVIRVITLNNLALRRMHLHIDALVLLVFEIDLQAVLSIPFI
jgi:hypothetical protein